MALTILVTPIAGDIIQASTWINEFNNIYNNPISLISPLTATVDLNSQTLSGAATFSGAITFSSTVRITSVDVGHASDTTVTRSAAGIIAVEGVAVPTISSTDSLSNKTIASPVFSGTVTGTYTLGGTPTFPSSVSFATSVAIGTTPATAGELRLPNSGTIQLRNAADTANRITLRMDANDHLWLQASGTLVIANDATATVTVTDTLIVIYESTADTGAVFFISAGGTIAEISDPSGAYSTTGGTANSTNLTHSGGTLTIENKRGGSRTYTIAAIGRGTL